MPDPLLSVEQLAVSYPVRSGLFQRQTGTVHAVQQVSFSIYPGETLGLVGESGCGKSTLGRAILRLIEPDAGRVVFQGTDLQTLSPRDMQAMRRNMQLIFQDPAAALNPRRSIRETLCEPLRIHKLCASTQAEEQRLQQLLDYVQLPTTALDKYPHEFSGGQQQRICIARALAVEPKFLVCDESVAALDVSVQAQVLNLLMDLQQELGLTYLFITHDLHVVQAIAHRIAVMYLGKIVEVAPAHTLMHTPQHPYTAALLAAAPVPNPGQEIPPPLEGDLPNPIRLPSGCAFHPRCARATPHCTQNDPLETTAEAGHSYRCFHPLHPHAKN